MRMHLDICGVSISITFTLMLICRMSEIQKVRFCPRRVSVATSCANFSLPLDLFPGSSLTIFAARIGVCKYDFARQQVGYGGTKAG
jgi:hypothetical protein